MSIDSDAVSVETREGSDLPSTAPSGVFRSQYIFWWLMALVWFIVISVLPDPRPLAAPDWALRFLTGAVSLSEASARVVATIVLRGLGFGLIGFLISLGLCAMRLRWQAVLALVIAPGLAIASQWINHGHMPIAVQMQLSALSSMAGVLLGLGLRRNRIAIGLLMIGIVGTILFSKPNRISPDLDAYARATGLHVLSYASSIPDRDEGFVESMRVAIAFAEDNSHGTDPVVPNQAAILALGVVLGEARVAQMAGRTFDLSRSGEMESMRNRTTLGGRHDLSRHFWVSAALVVLTGESRALMIGTGKELLDSMPGGSGFSFVDQLANNAGVRFAISATANPESALEMQLRILGGLNSEDFLPDIEGLPEQIRSDEFRSEFGGLGGAKTQSLNAEILRRIGTRAGLNIALDLSR